MPSAQPNLPCKLHRPYLAANMSKIECLFALRDHYDLIAQRMPLKMRLATSARSLRAGPRDGQKRSADRAGTGGDRQAE
ncbi:VirK/YbjX family protein [Serratia ureilytica]